MGLTLFYTAEERDDLYAAKRAARDGVSAPAAVAPLKAVPKAPPPGKRGKPAGGTYPADHTAVQNAIHIDYVLSWVYAGNVIAAMPLPFHPSVFHISEPYATNLERTFGEDPKREHARPQEWDIVLAGRIGTASRVWYSGDGGSPHSATPMNIINKFQQFLDDYQKGAAAAGAMAISSEQYAFRNFLNHYLVMHAFVENKHYCVDVVKFDYDRTATDSRHSATWALTLKGWRDYGNSVGSTKRWGFPTNTLSSEDPAVSAARRGELLVRRDLEASDASIAFYAEQAALGDVDAQRKLGVFVNDKAIGPSAAAAAVLEPKTSAWVNGATRLAKVLRNSASSAQAMLLPAQKVRGEMGAVIGQYIKAVYSYQQVAADVRGLAQAPQHLLMAAYQALSGLRSAMDDLYDAHTALTPAAWRDVALPPMLDMAGMDLATTIGLLGGKLRDLPEVSFGQQMGALSAEADNSTPYTVPAGAYSWSAVAIGLYGNSEYTAALMALNGAQDGYSDVFGAPIYPGMAIQVPAAPGEGQSNADGSPNDINSLFGTDFRVDDVTGDWVPNTDEYLTGVAGVLELAGGGGTDVQLVSGYANLRQAVYTMISTPRGSVDVDQTFGLQLGRIGAAGPTTGQLAMVPVLVRKDLLADGRVADVRNVVTSYENDAWITAFDVVPIGPDPQALPVLAPVLPQW